MKAVVDSISNKRGGIFGRFVGKVLSNRLNAVMEKAADKFKEIKGA